MTNKQQLKEWESREYTILESNFDQVAKVFSLNTKMFDMHYELFENEPEKVQVIVEAEEDELLQIDSVLKMQGLVF